MKSLLLDRTTWDLCKDANGNIAVADSPYALAQDVACAIRLFKGELWFDTTKGVPHFQQILGHRPSLSVLKAALQTAALTVPEVATATVFVSGVKNREVQGQVQVTSTTGATVPVISGITTPKPA
jgi:hypothetical protein